MVNFEVASSSSFRGDKNHFVTAAEADTDDSINSKMVSLKKWINCNVSSSKRAVTERLR